MPLWTSSWRSVNYDMTLAEGVKEVASLNPDAISVFHSRISETTAALQVVLDQWSGTVILYPDAGRTDYLETWQDSSIANEETVDELTQEAAKWIETGAQVIGTCCGFGANYTKALSTALPAHVKGR